MTKKAKILCSYRFTKEHIKKLRRVAKKKKTTVTEILERAIVSIKEV